MYKTAILTNLCMFGVIFRGHSFGEKVGIVILITVIRRYQYFVLKTNKQQHIFPSFHSGHSSGSKQRSHQQLSLSLPVTGWKSSSRESVLLLCQGRVQVWHCSGCLRALCKQLATSPFRSGLGQATD